MLATDKIKVLKLLEEFFFEHKSTCNLTSKECPTVKRMAEARDILTGVR